MDVREWKDEIVFLHKVKAGAADRSYGIQVAKLAGLPKPVTARAGEVLALLEKADKAPDGEALLGDLPLFAAARPKSHVAGRCRPLARRGGARRRQPRRADAEGRAGGPLPPEGAGEQGSGVKTATRSARRQHREHRVPVGAARVGGERRDRGCEG